MVKHIFTFETDDEWTDDYEELLSDSTVGFLDFLSEHGVHFVTADRFTYDEYESDHFRYVPEMAPE